MLVDTNKNRGRAGMGLAIAYYSSNGYTVSIPLNDTQWYDFVIEKDGVFQTVQCKCTTSEKKRVNLRSSGGTKGNVYDNILWHPIDILFCLNGETGEMYSIPVEEIRKAGIVRSITLNNAPSKNNQGLQSYRFQVYL